MNRIIRNRHLTVEEIAENNKIREQIKQELPDLIARHHQRMAAKSMIIVLPAAEIPDGIQCRKPNGQKSYILKRQVKIHGEGQTVFLADGVVFLVDNNSITGIKDTTLLAVEMSDDELIEFLEDRKNSRES